MKCTNLRVEGKQGSFAVGIKSATVFVFFLFVKINVQLLPYCFDRLTSLFWLEHFTEFLFRVHTLG